MLSQVLIVLSLCTLAWGQNGFLTFPLTDASQPIFHGWYYDVYNDKHGAIDVIRPEGTAVVAAAPGRAIASCQPPFTSSRGEEGQYGYFVLIDHLNGYSTLYAHLKEVDLPPGSQVPCAGRFNITASNHAVVYAGQSYPWIEVTRGAKIGEVGNSGASYIHLHFEISVDNTGSYSTHKIGTQTKVDSYNIYSVASNYPPPAGCSGIDATKYLWTQCPPVSASLPAPTCSLSAQPTAINQGQSSTLTWTTTGSPTGASINNGIGSVNSPGSGSIKVSPAVDTTYTLTVTNAAGSFPCSSSITVNRPPVIGSTAITNAVVSQQYSYQVVAQDPENGTLTFSLSSSPVGMTIGIASGLIQWTPAQTQIGSNSVSVKATDSGGLMATQDFTITVAPSSAPTWTLKVPTNSPSARDKSAMVYDVLRQQIVLFGGVDNTGTSLADTWVWDGAVWTQKFPATIPPARSDHAMAYDTSHGQVLMYGGASNGFAGFYKDTWVWDGTNWTQKFPSNSPGAMVWHAMAYDGSQGRVVLFGGEGVGGGGCFLVACAETWVWDGANWTDVCAAFMGCTVPTPRFWHSLTYDSFRNQVVLFGGRTQSGVYLSDTWVWDGTNWTQTASAPESRVLHGAAYDGHVKKLVVFGGLTLISPPDPAADYSNETWVWDGSSWVQDFSSLSPSPRSQPAIAYDVIRHQTLLFGGFASSVRSSETWVLTEP